MSQIFKDLSAGPVPPAVPDQFTVDVGGPAVPVANNLNLYARDSTADDEDGIRTNNDASGSETVYVELTNRLTGSGSITGAVTGDLITFALSESSVYRFEFFVTGRETTTGDGVGYTVFCSAKRVGAGAASIVQTPWVDSDEDASLAGASIDVVASGNNIILQGTGVAATTITYKAVGTYVKV